MADGLKHRATASEDGRNNRRRGGALRASAGLPTFPRFDMGRASRMTRTHPSFPIAFRVVAIFFALAAVLGVAAIPGAATPKDDLEEAKQERQDIQDRVEAARAEYDVISADLAVKSAEVEEAEARLEDITANLLTS